MKKMKLSLILILLVIIIPLSMSTISAHGADVTDNVMVITNESNGIMTKKIVDELGLNVTVYKYTSEEEVSHVLEHTLSNSNKRILILSYQNIGKEFLNKHGEVSNRVIIIDDVNEENIKKGLNQLVTNTDKSTNTISNTNFIIPLTIGTIIGLIIGLSCGVLLMKNKKG